MKRLLKHITIALSACALILSAGCATAIAESQDDLPTAKYEAFLKVDDLGGPTVIERIADDIERKQAEEEAAMEAEAAYEAALEEEWYYESQEWDSVPYSGYGNDYGNPFKQEGVTSDENYEYTWYSQNVLGGSGLDELNANGRHVDEDTGFIVDGDGYIAVAMNGVEQGTVIDPKWGEAKVYDTKDDGAPYDGTVDVYTDF